MACCLTAPSHYLNQCWLIIHEVSWHSSEGNFTGPAQDSYPWYKFENYQLKMTARSPSAQWINSLRPDDAYIHKKTHQHWFRQWLVAWSVPSHCLNQCWGIVNWTLRNKLQWNFNQNSQLFIHKDAFENVVWKMAAILSWAQCGHGLTFTCHYATRMCDVHGESCMEAYWPTSHVDSQLVRDSVS